MKKEQKITHYLVQRLVTVIELVWCPESRSVPQILVRVCPYLMKFVRALFLCQRWNLHAFLKEILWFEVLELEIKNGLSICFLLREVVVFWIEIQRRLEYCWRIYCKSCWDPYFGVPSTFCAVLQPGRFSQMHVIFVSTLEISSSRLSQRLASNCGLDKVVEILRYQMHLRKTSSLKNCSTSRGNWKKDPSTIYNEIRQ